MRSSLQVYKSTGFKLHSLLEEVIDNLCSSIFSLHSQFYHLVLPIRPFYHFMYYVLCFFFSALIFVLKTAMFSACWTGAGSIRRSVHPRIALHLHGVYKYSL